MSEIIFSEPNERLARRLIDPPNRATELQLADYLIELYGDKVLLDGDGNVTSDSTTQFDQEQLTVELAFDATESAIATPEEIKYWVAEFQPDAYFIEEHFAIQSVLKVNREAKERAELLFESISPSPYRPDAQRMLIVIDRLARQSYRDFPDRVSTGKPYYTHPQQAAAMAFHVLSNLKEKHNDISEDFINAVIVGVLMHDAFEGTARAGKYYRPDRPKDATPLLVSHVMQIAGNPLAQETARTLRLMTHLRRREWMPTYPDYIKVGSEEFLFDIMKAPDVKHNLDIEPKTVPEEIQGDLRAEKEKKIHDKRIMYLGSFERMRFRGTELAVGKPEEAWAEDYFLDLNAIRPEQVGPMVEALDEYMYGLAA